MQLDRSPHVQRQVEVTNTAHAANYSCSSAFQLRKLGSFLSTTRRGPVSWVPSVIAVLEQQSWWTRRAWRGKLGASTELWFSPSPSHSHSPSSPSLLPPTLPFPSPSFSLPWGEQTF